MDKVIFLLLLISQLFLFKCQYEINLISSYNFGSGVYNFKFDNINYDYYIFSNLLTKNNRIYFTFCYELSSFFVYTRTSSTIMDKYAIERNIDYFQKQKLEKIYYSENKQYCYYFDYKKYGSNLYYYIAIHLSDASSNKIYSMQLNSYILQGKTFLNTTYKYNSGKDSFIFERNKYEYYVLGNNITSKNKLYFKFYYPLNKLYVYTYTTYSPINNNNIQDKLDFFEFQPSTVSNYSINEYCFSFDYKKIGNNDNYLYIAISLSEYASKDGVYQIRIDSYTSNPWMVLIIIIIIFGVLVGICLIFMCIAKCMGRSSVEGCCLLCILCSLCSLKSKY